MSVIGKKKLSVELNRFCYVGKDARVDTDVGLSIVHRPTFGFFPVKTLKAPFTQFDVRCQSLKE